MKTIELVDLFEYLKTKYLYSFVNINIQFKSVKRGRARYLTNSITIPLWILNYPIEYQYYYIIHEVTHFIAIYQGHNDMFKQKEKELLNEFGLIPIYNRVYIKQLNGINGDVKYKRNWL